MEFDEKSNRWRVKLIECKSYIPSKLKKGFKVKRENLQLINYIKIKILKLDGTEYQLMLSPNNTVNEIRRQLDKTHGINPVTYNLVKENSNIYLNGFEKFNTSHKLLMIVYDNLPKTWKSVTDLTIQSCEKYNQSIIYYFYNELKPSVRFTKLPEWCECENIVDILKKISQICVLSDYQIESMINQYASSIDDDEIFELHKKESSIDDDEIFELHKKELKKELETHSIIDKIELYRTNVDFNLYGGPIVIDLFK